MIILGDCLISEDILEKKFSCDVTACKGACCIEGDAGAPLEDHESAPIRDNIDLIKAEMDEQGLETLEESGFSERDPFDTMLVTTCKPNKECVFVVRKDGILNCAIEIANAKHDFGFPKPISCHLYPIREHQYGEYHALNYHKWSICADACKKGERDDVRVFEFAKTALTRKFGAAWYSELEKVADAYRNER